MNGGAKVTPRNGFAIRGATVVELPAINQLPCTVEQIEVRCTGCREQPRDLLGTVEQERESPGFMFCQGLHVFWPILRMSRQAVRVDCYYADPQIESFVGGPYELCTNVNDERAMIANEHDQQALARLDCMDMYQLSRYGIG